MTAKPFQFKILRFKTDAIDPPRFQEYRLQVTEGMTVMDCLEKIRVEQDRTLMYGHACHHASCGTCACRINGAERLACIAQVWTLGGTEIRLEPLKRFRCLGDLVVDKRSFFSDIDSRWSCLRPSERELAGEDFQRFENCIECGCCVSACPIVGENKRFLGPAALASLHRELQKNIGWKRNLMGLAGGDRGERHCKRVLSCSRVCPSRVFPARHIADLRRKLKTI